MKQATVEKMAVICELCGGSRPSQPVIEIMIMALDHYGDDAVSKALDRCAREVRGHIAPADIISRIDDGRPSPNEAWAMLPKSEAESVCWTHEMARAASVVNGMRDEAAARLAFIEAYKRECLAAHGQPVKWMMSYGTDPHHRETVARSAMELGRIPIGCVRHVLTFSERSSNMLTDGDEAENMRAIVSAAITKMEA